MGVGERKWERSYVAGQLSRLDRGGWIVCFFLSFTESLSLVEQWEEEAGLSVGLWNLYWIAAVSRSKAPSQRRAAVEYMGS